MTTKEIAEAVGKDERTVQRWIKKAGDKMSSAGHGVSADFSLRGSPRMSYFLAGFLGGLPMGASRISSSADFSYSDSCVFGFKPLRNNRSFTVLRGKLSIPAISEAVYPSMFKFSDCIQKIIKNIAKKHHFFLDEVKLLSYI